jgi:hypothetical protein
LKQILYITEHNPFGVAIGAQQRSNLIFRALQKAGHVHLFCISKELPPEVHNTITPFAARGGDKFLSQRENVSIASDARTFAQAVIQLLENDELNRRLGIQAASTIDKHFSYHAFEQKTIQVISIKTGKTT